MANYALQLCTLVFQYNKKKDQRKKNRLNPSLEADRSIRVSRDSPQNRNRLELLYNSRLLIVARATTLPLHYSITVAPTQSEILKAKFVEFSK